MANKKKIVASLLYVIPLLLISVNTDACARDYLFKDGKTSYCIVQSSDASVTEINAAKELKDYLEQISGASFSITSSPKQKNIYVGYDKSFDVYSGVEPYPYDSEGFTIRKINHDLVIYGGAERGTMFGVFRFLQEYLGVQWYTPDFTKIPVAKKYVLENIGLSERPKIKYRFTNFVCAQDIPWLAHNMMNTARQKKANPYGLKSHYQGTHSMKSFLPASKYYESHPEYFALCDGERIDNGQHCLSNPDVLRIVKEEVMAVIDKYPNYLVYDVSQKDGLKFCTCDKCVELEKKYGGHSGLMVWFVNQVAREVKKKYPDKYIGTFAYQYTRQAPTNIRPDDNVVIRLCTNGCCFAHPLSSECNENNAAFMNDLREWSRLTKNLYIWDYVVNYSNFMAPFPNIQVLGPNLRTFSEFGVIDVFEEAQGASLGNAFEELKCWILGQLMWNPDLNTDELVAQFIDDYYGAAAGDIMDFYNLCLSLVGDNTHLRSFSDTKKAPFTDEFCDEAYKILNKALKHAENETILERVNKVMLQPMALECARRPKDFYKKGRWPEFKGQILKYKANFKTGVDSEKFIDSYEAKVK